MTEQMNDNKRFGMIAVEKGYVSQSNIVAALTIQVDDNMGLGLHRKIGTILFDQGLLTASQIHDVLSSISSTAKLAT